MSYQKSHGSGNVNNDTFHGTDQGDNADAGRGNDTMYGYGGDDWLKGGAGNDKLVGGQGRDRLEGGSGADTFVFEARHGNDEITDFKPGTDKIDLKAFSEGISWFDLRDNMKATSDGVKIDLGKWDGGGTILLKGIDSPNALSENDFRLPSASLRLTGTDSNDNLHGDSDHDDISGRDGSDYLVGYEGNDHLKGGAGSDFIVGAAGDDRIVGGAGNDTLYGDGWAGDDTYRDGTAVSDNDTFVYTRGGGHDTIMDFTSGEDNIDLTDFTGITSFDDINARQDGNNVVIDFSSNGGGKITLSDFDIDDLNASNFTFHGDVDGV